jgi:hypothetical protein
VWFFLRQLAAVRGARRATTGQGQWCSGLHGATLGRCPQPVDPRSSVNGLLLTGSPRFREVSLKERRSVCRLKQSAPADAPADLLDVRGSRPASAYRRWAGLACQTPRTSYWLHRPTTLQSSPFAAAHDTSVAATGGRNIATTPAIAASTTAPQSDAVTPAVWYRTPERSVPISRPAALAM